MDHLRHVAFILLLMISACTTADPALEIDGETCTALDGTLTGFASSGLVSIQPSASTSGGVVMTYATGAPHTHSSGLTASLAVDVRDEIAIVVGLGPTGSVLEVSTVDGGSIEPCLTETDTQLSAVFVPLAELDLPIRLVFAGNELAMHTGDLDQLRREPGSVVKGA